MKNEELTIAVESRWSMANNKLLTWISSFAGNNQRHRSSQLIFIPSRGERERERERES